MNAAEFAAQIIRSEQAKRLARTPKAIDLIDLGIASLYADAARAGLGDEVQAILNQSTPSKEAKMTEATNNAAPHLKSFVERIERLEEEKKQVSDDIKDVYAEAKSNGFDVKALRTIIRIRKQDAAERAEQQAIIDTYMHALGMLADTPLGEAAVDRAVSNKNLRKAVAALGTPTELTDDEKAKGYTAAFIGKDGTRMTIGTSSSI